MTRHGGDVHALAARAGCALADLLDCSASINPLGPPPWWRDEISRSLDLLVHYPEPDARSLRAAAATAWGVPVDGLVAGNGSSELLFALLRLWSGPGRRVVLPQPCYGDYTAAALAAGATVLPLPLPEAQGFALDPTALSAVLQPGDVAVLGHPNNPTGLALEAADLRRLIAAHPRSRFLVDEAFIDFCPPGRSLLPEVPANVAVLRSLTKNFAIPGLRLGLAVLAADQAAAVARSLPQWTVNTLAQVVGARALADRDHLQRSAAAVTAGRAALAAGLHDLGFTTLPGLANWLLARLPAAVAGGEALAEALLLRHRIAVRTCTSFPGLGDRWLRLAVRRDDEQGRLLAALREEMGSQGSVGVPARRRTPALMLQGTASSAGKSVLTAAFCRILLQDGYDVAPYKSQNMALNSGVTADGCEMGRAQILQARACRLEPDVRMNPILLKPSSDTGSQVIVLGRPVGSMRVAEYHRYKPTAWLAAARAYDELAAEHQVMVIEGAGSPGEINLKSHDIANMKVAAHAGAPVLLVGDIDRGGVYASFAGTFETLDDAERRLTAGFLVNRFRGDASLLAPAHAWLRARTGRPVLGVVPYLHDLGLPEEDSVAFKAGAMDGGDGDLDVAVIDLPHISNFTDLDPLRLEADVRLRRVGRAEDLGRPDLLIIPGSKNTIGDLGFLRARGLDQAIRAFTGEIHGICGGLQILGTSVGDPLGIESPGPALAGLGLLPLVTVMAAEKTLVRTTARFLPTGQTVQGYEIHHGISTAAAGAEAAVRRADGQVIGWQAEGGRVWGSYLHGIYDDDAFRRDLLDRLLAAKGLPPLLRRTPFDLDAALDRLADAVRRSVDLPAIYRLMGLA